jgi:hypothetical protein
METHRLAAHERFGLAFGAVVMLAVAGMFQCASLAVGAPAREVLVLLADIVAVLCVSLLVEDFAAPAVRNAAALVSRRLRTC